MKIANGIEMLEISSMVMGKSNTIYPVLLFDGKSVILSDSGYPGQAQLFQEALEKNNLSLDRLNKIILTHHDIDHIGSLSSILKESNGNIEVFSHREEKPYIEGEKRAVKLAGLEANLDSLPDQMKPIYEVFKNFYDNNKSKVDAVVSDGESLPYCGSITVIHTPGHTPGHICLYHSASKTLIAGDALSVQDGNLALLQASANMDNALVLESLKKLISYDIENVICYHGGLYKGNISERILELING